ncbi:MAG TPA: DUF4129 domain-containing transglutaminase family protein [Bacilli bacterium]
MESVLVKGAKLLLRFPRTDWRLKLRSLVSLMMILQFLELFAQSWWPETMRAVKVTIIALAVLDMLFPRMKTLVRYFAGVCVSVAATGYVLRLDLSAIEFANWPDFWRTFAAATYALHPVVWFPLGCFAAYRVLLLFMRSQGNIISMMVCGTIFLAVVDSFSTYQLWENVAVFVLCGLTLLVVEHSEYLRRRHPESWKHIAEYPETLLATIIIIALLIIIAANIAPNARPLLTDPYSAWKKAHGEEVAFSSKSVAGIRLETPGKSGYERSSETLGGAFDFDYSPVMLVDTEHKSYWRGETRTVYTGTGWQDPVDEQDGALVQANAALPQVGLAQTNGETVSNRQTIRVLNEEKFPVLFGAYAIAKVETIVNGNDPDLAPGNFANLRWFSENGELKWSDAKTYPQTYTIFSEMPVIDEEKLRATAETADAETLRTYTQLPETLPARVRELAESITADKTNAYDKVKALADYLQNTYRYNNKPDMTKAQSTDFVDSFLFEVKEGYCDYYSTAMVVLTRSLGIPARWVKGYSTGVPENLEMIPGDIYSEDIDLIDGGVYMVRNSNAHSWAEVYFAGSGWVPFEATPGFRMPLQISQHKTAAAIDIETAPDQTAADNRDARLIPGAVGIAAVLLIVAAGFLARKFGLIAAFAAGLPRRKKQQAKQIALAELSRLRKFLARKGYLRKEHETFREAAARWSITSPALQPAFADLVSCMEKAAFSRMGLTPADAEKLEKTAQIIRNELNAKRR